MDDKSQIINNNLLNKQDIKEYQIYMTSKENCNNNIINIKEKNINKDKLCEINKAYYHNNKDKKSQ